ncbi:hypothetical protein ACTTAM_20175 (plasmid) [Rhodobacter capsulatus]|uniref:hypothetical protein n=1 Tax=Rhodobacter capsulatus TaxID=1061 RepID=UPI004029F4B9
MQQSGLQILDSIVYSSDDKIVSAALGEVRNMLNNLTGANSVTVSNLLSAIDRVATMASKNQIEVSAFTMKAIEGARKDLQDYSDKGQYVLKLADETVGRAMSMAERVAMDQARNQQQALEIVAEAKTGDYADTLKQVSGMVMGFTLLALIIIKGR